MNKKGIGIIIMSVFMLVGCAKTESQQDTQTLLVKETQDTQTEETVYNHVPMQYGRESDKRFKIFPSYYQQDYKDPLGDSTIAESGNLLTCLAMIYSYEKDEYVTPPEMMERFSDCFNETGMDKDAIMSAIGANLGMKFYEEEIDIEEAASWVNDIGYYLLIRIAHPSMYGDLSTYVIIENSTDDGRLIIRDPNKNNIENLAYINSDGEPEYWAFELFAAAGHTAQMYVLMYYDGEDISYEDIIEYQQQYEEVLEDDE